MARPKATPTNREQRFELHELFFSTTDAKGLIRTGNSVFVRVSGWSREELHGEPHNIIRHPDMPRVVFRLLWDYIQQGKTIAAYVKNLAKDGNYYWVVAVVSKIGDGYLSVRFKPTSALFPAVQQVYQQVLMVEREVLSSGADINSAIDASASRLFQLLNQAGFSDYDAFMATAIAEELKSRRAALTAGLGSSKNGRAYAAAKKGGDQFKGGLGDLLNTCLRIEAKLEHVFSNVNSLIALNNELQEQSDFVSQLAKTIRVLSLNALIEAIRLSDSGATLGVVAERMAKYSDEGMIIIDEFNGLITNLASNVRHAIFAVCAAKLDIEMATFFAKELLEERSTEQSALKTGQNIEEIRQHIDTLLFKSFSDDAGKMFSRLRLLQENLSKLDSGVKSLRDLVRTLELIHLNGKVEAARVPNAEGFEHIFSEVLAQVSDARTKLDDFADTIAATSARLGEIDSHNRTVTNLLFQLSKTDLLAEGPTGAASS